MVYTEFRWTIEQRHANSIFIVGTARRRLAHGDRHNHRGAAARLQQAQKEREEEQLRLLRLHDL